MARELAEWLTQYLHRPVLVCAVLGVLPFTGILSAAVITLVVLRRGARDGLFVCLGAAALIGVMALLVSVPVWGWVVSAGVMWIPALGLAALLRLSGSLNLAVQVAVVLGCVSIVLGFGFADPVAASNRFIETVFLPFLEQLGAPIDPGVDFSQLAWFMPGFMISSASLGFLLSLFLGRWLQKLLVEPGSFGAEFRSLRMGLVIGILGSFVFVITPLTPYAVFDNLVLVLLVGFVMQGISVAHTVVQAYGLNIGILLVMYILFPLVPILATTMMAGIGFTDNWLNLKAMAARGKSS